MTDSLSQYCPNCEAQANTIEELRAANERWVIAFNLAEERANSRIETLQADKARLQAQNESLLKAIAAFVNQHRGSTHKGIDELDHLRTITYEAGLFDDQKIFPALQETGQ
jgi:hypothetical protein